ncbi:MAG: hypothetical protein CMA63_00645 [Euryarchaeota archaeon]|mgnify:CR=1 FL=1|nr:hypothetical protein [Euryarchaeota archaeon]|tara:strand:+ start:18292 stop:18885 length:594 start_codon:yes stop_codon:yes gene_type:complete
MGKAVPAVVLAAGASSRLGQPKSLVCIEGVSLVALAHRRLVLAGCSPILVVTRQELSFEVMHEVPGATVVVNTEPERGRTGSLQCALQSLMADKGRIPHSVIVAPVDRPGWNASHVRSLIDAPANSTLMHNGRKGHPLIMDQTACRNVLSAPTDTPLRDIVHFHPLEVSAPLLHLNIDSPSDLQLLCEHANSLLSDG